MGAAAAAFAREFRSRHRWGLTAVVVYLLGMGSIKFLALGSQRAQFSSSATFALVVVVPITATFIYLLAVFSFGLAGDLAARQSMYPARLFTLPLTNAALAGWPMLYGSAAMMMLWLATRLCAVWPTAGTVPVLWPGVLTASLLAWTQALTWMPYPLPGLRIVVTVLWLAVIDTLVLLALHFQASEVVMLAILAPHLPCAYLTARQAVTRARRGDVPDWRTAATASGPARPRAPFRSSLRAQIWFEWRRHGRALPTLVGMLLPFELALLFVFPDTPVLVYETLFAVLITPALMAGFVAAALSNSDGERRDASGLTPLNATRPLTTAALVAAKLNAAAWSTAAAWLLVLVAIPVALELSGTSPVVIERARHVHDAAGTPRSIVVALLGLSGLVAWTWRRLVDNLYVGMTGREWLIKGSVLSTLALIGAAGPMLHWIGGSARAGSALWDASPLILAALVAIKMAAAAWIATRLYRTRLLSDRALVCGAAVWCAAVFALYAVLVWLVDTPFFPRYILALVAIVVIPLTRISAAPLALAWNRHR